MKSESKINDYQACFEDYRGKKIFLVCHPKHRSVKVCAPDQNSAIVTAENTGVSNGQAIPFMPIARYQNVE